MTRLQA